MSTTSLQIERVAIDRSMELDTKYCDVIVRRWQQFTGKRAVHAVSGQEFGE